MGEIYLIYSNLYTDYREIVGYTFLKESADDYCEEHSSEDLTIIKVNHI